MAKEISRAAEENYERKAGLYILITIVIVLGILFVLGKDKKIFIAKYNLTATFEHGRLIDKNTGITLAGLKVGHVVEIYINEKNKIDVVMSIRKEFQELIRDDSVATLVSSLLTGSVIDISIGSSGSMVLEDGNKIVSSATEEIADKVSVNILLPKASEIEDIIKTKIPSFMEKVDNVFGIIDNLVERLGNSSSNLNKLIGNLEKFSYKLNESDLIVQSGTFMANAGKLTSDINNITDGFPVLIKKVVVFIDAFNNVLNDLKVITGDLKEKSPDLSHMVESADGLLDDLSEVIEASKKSFFLKKHLRKTDERQIMINEERRDLILETN
ncbi:MAG: MlaD family protein [Candidatus Anammoxibacter sp.]